MDFDNVSIGTDIEDVSRFKNKTLENYNKFLTRVFTNKELLYCFSKGVPHQHLCARFCAKESVIKALSNFKIKDIFYVDIEILNDETGKPTCCIAKYPNINIKISLSHCKNYATATAILYKKQ